MRLGNPRKRRGLATIITSAIMMSAVCALGSTGIVWSQSTLTSQQVEMTDTVQQYTNKLNESLNFEYVYCNDDPCETVVVVLTNVGNVGLEVSQVSISNDIAGFNKIETISNGGIMPDSSISISIFDPTFSSYDVLDIKTTTSRGNILHTQIST